MGMTSAERQRAFRARREAEGFFSVSGIVASRQVAEVNQLLRTLRLNPDLVPVHTFRNVNTGRMVKVSPHPDLIPIPVGAVPAKLG